MNRYMSLFTLASLTVLTLGCGHYITRTVQRLDLHVLHAESNEPVAGGFVQLKIAPPSKSRAKKEPVSDDAWMLQHPSFTSATDASGVAIVHVTELGYESGPLPDPAELVRNREFVCVVVSMGMRDAFRVIMARKGTYRSEHFVISVSEVSEPAIMPASWQDSETP